jgi:hypothetical protein
MLYKLKGYPDDWIEKRMRGIAIREELADEWQKRGAQEDRDYEILTAEISKATFGVTPSQYLRDHTRLPAGRWMILCDYQFMFEEKSPAILEDNLKNVLGNQLFPSKII